MDPLLKKILNSLSCPICKAPVDTLSYKAYIGYSYGCAMNPDHYLIRLDNCVLIIETVHIYDDKHKYTISNHYTGDKLKTIINVHETDAEGRVIFSFKEKKLALDKAYFDFRRFNVDNAVNRIKTIFTFY